jgi:hypothetical protein
VLVRRALPLALAIPYLRTLSAARSWGVRRAAQVAATEAIADAVGGAALLRGTVRHRSLLV